VEAVEALLQHGAHVNVQNNLTGATPIHCAAQSNKGTDERRVACIDLLLQHGADLATVDYFGKTALAYVTTEDTNHHQNPQLLASKLHPQTPPLFAAIQEGNLQQVQELLQQEEEEEDGSAARTSLYLGQTPFLFAVHKLLDDAEKDENLEQNHVRILMALLEAGADVQSASASLGGNNHKNPMQALEGDGPSPPLCRICTALQSAYKNQNNNNNGTTTTTVSILENLAKLFLEHGAVVTPELEQMLHTACRKNELPLTKFLIETIGINPNVKGRQGMTALQFAARSGKIDVVGFLLQCPTIDVAIKDDRGQTALDAARVNGKTEIVALLEQHGNNNHNE